MASGYPHSPSNLGAVHVYREADRCTDAQLREVVRQDERMGWMATMRITCKMWSVSAILVGWTVGTIGRRDLSRRLG